jgi:hypothetical protein
MGYWQRKAEKEVVGKKFGKWKVLAYAGTDGRRSFVTAECECGTLEIVQMGNIVGGTSKGCKSCMGPAHLIHGHTAGGRRSPEWLAWRTMKIACTVPGSKSYQWVGGRGIKYYQHWNNFETFLAYMGRKPKNTVLTRVDTGSNFVPGNTVWMPRLEAGRRLAAHMNAVRAARKAA